MRFRRFFTAAAATVAFGLAFTFGQGQTAQASINSDAKKKTYSGTKSLETLLKAAGLSYNQFNSVANGKKYGSRFGYRKGVGKPEGIVVHETATPGATAWDEGRYFNDNWTSVYSYVHAVVDNNQTIQLMSTDYGTWGAGPIANVRYIQIELCEVSTRSQFVQSVANDAYYIATLLHQYNLTPSRASKSGTGTIWSHNEVSQYLGGTDHGDPDSYFAKWGYSMSDFYSLITYYYNKLGTSSNSGSSSSSQAPATQPVSTKTVKLIRNSYSYDAYGKKLAVKALKAGSSLKVYGSAVTIGSSKYYKYADGKYVKGGNIDGTSRTLTGNSWTYTISGSREWSTAKLLKGSKVTTYGSQVKIKGKAYYMTGFTSNNVAKYVKAVNFQPKPVEVSTSKRLMRNSYSYSAAGKKLPDSMLKAGQYLKVYGSAVTIGKAKYYKYANGKYVKAGNIDGTNRPLKHNAYVYTVKGTRNWSEAKRLKGSTVTTYGSRVKLAGKYYYMVGFSGQTALYLKAGNF
jgi:N-acetylmuramoyl-L-alanine amidase